MPHRSQHVGRDTSQAGPAFRRFICGRGRAFVLPINPLPSHIVLSEKRTDHGRRDPQESSALGRRRPAERSGDQHVQCVTPWHGSAMSSRLRRCGSSMSGGKSESIFPPGGCRVLSTLLLSCVRGAVCAGSAWMDAACPWLQERDGGRVLQLSAGRRHLHLMWEPVCLHPGSQNMHLSGGGRVCQPPERGWQVHLKIS